MRIPNNMGKLSRDFIYVIACDIRLFFLIITIVALFSSGFIFYVIFYEIFIWCRCMYREMATSYFYVDKTYDLSYI